MREQVGQHTTTLWHCVMLCGVMCRTVVLRGIVCHSVALCCVVLALRTQVKELQEQILRPRLLRRLKEDVEKSIPKKEEVIIWVELTRQQRVYYKALFEQSIGTLLEGAKPQNLPNLRNLVSHTRRLHTSPLAAHKP